MGTTIVLVAFIGFVAQFVDGSLGMGYGVTSTTLLMSVGLAPAVASASVHMAELGTTAASGISHWRFGNVDWKTVWPLAIPGGIGAFIGAVVLSNLSAEVAKPWVSLILSCLAGVILVRALLGRAAPSNAVVRPRARRLGPLGLVGGFLDALGGGGWGPVTTSTLMAATRMQPRYVIGTVSLSEFLVTAGASLGFVVGLGAAGFAWDAVLVLLAGGLAAAPVAAWVVRRVDFRTMGVAVAVMILYTNLSRVLVLAGVERAAADAVGYAILLAGIGLTAGLLIGRHTGDRRPVPVERTALSAEVPAASAAS